MPDVRNSVVRNRQTVRHWTYRTRRSAAQDAVVGGNSDSLIAGQYGAGTEILDDVVVDDGLVAGRTDSSAAGRIHIDHANDRVGAVRPHVEGIVVNVEVQDAVLLDAHLQVVATVCRRRDELRI